MNENLKRILTSIIFVPIIITSIFYEGSSTFRYWPFFCIMLTVAIFLGRELIYIVHSKGIRTYKKIIITTILLSLIVSYLSISIPNLFKSPLESFNYSSFLIFAIIGSTFFIFLIETFKADFKLTIETISAHIFIILYASIGIIFILKIQSISPWHLLYLWIITWMTDSGAYFIGKYFGKTKLNLKASPNKTLEGFIGGIVIGIIGALILKAIFPEIYNYKFAFIYSFPYIIIINLVFSLLTILGDMAESIIKRSGSIKDSDTYIPGHGGMLDVMDSLIYNSPLFYLILSLSLFNT